MTWKNPKKSIIDAWSINLWYHTVCVSGSLCDGIWTKYVYTHWFVMLVKSVFIKRISYYMFPWRTLSILFILNCKQAKTYFLCLAISQNQYFAWSQHIWIRGASLMGSLLPPNWWWRSLVSSCAIVFNFFCFVLEYREYFLAHFWLMEDPF